MRSKMTIVILSVAKNLCPIVSDPVEILHFVHDDSAQLKNYDRVVIF